MHKVRGGDKMAHLYQNHLQSTMDSHDSDSFLRIERGMHPMLNHAFKMVQNFYVLAILCITRVRALARTNVG